MNRFKPSDQPPIDHTPDDRPAPITLHPTSSGTGTDLGPSGGGLLVRAPSVSPDRPGVPELVFREADDEFRAACKRDAQALRSQGNELAARVGSRMAEVGAARTRWHLARTETERLARRGGIIPFPARDAAAALDAAEEAVASATSDLATARADLEVFQATADDQLDNGKEARRRERHEALVTFAQAWADVNGAGIFLDDWLDDVASHTVPSVADITIDTRHPGKAWS